jgi:hypothetical protein
MAQDYSISKCTRKCAISGRAFEPGESYVSVVVPRGDEVSRMDIAASEWKGPQPETIGWWRNKMPDAAAKKLRPAPNGVLLDTLSELTERPEKEPLAYLLALLLVRRRVLSEERQIELDATEEPASHWKLVCAADGRQWNIPIVVPTSAGLDALQEELSALLFTEE